MGLLKLEMVRIIVLPFVPITDLLTLIVSYTISVLFIDSVLGLFGSC